MKALILILLTAIVAVGQHRNTTLDAPLPAPGSPGTVTLSLSEYDRLVASRAFYRCESKYNAAASRIASCGTGVG